MVLESLPGSRINKGPPQILNRVQNPAVKADLPHLRIKTVNESVKNSGTGQLIAQIIPGQPFLGIFAESTLFVAEGIVVMRKKPPPEILKTFLRLLQHGS